MAEDYQRVVDLPVKTASGISLLSDYLMGIDTNDGYQMLINDLAKKIVEDYIGSSLGGTSRTLKSALDAISTLLGNSTMGTTAPTVTGAIAEHEGDISSIGTTIGNTSMGTTAATVTGAIKEHSDKIGNSTMGTTASTLTGAIAEHEGDIDDIDDLIGNSTMGTTATTITGAIAEHESDISTLNNKLTNTAISGSDVITLANGISAVSIECYKNDYIIDLRVACKKTDGSAFSGRINPLFTINSGYRPKLAFGVVGVTNASVSSYMTGYCCAYFTTAGSVVVDTITTNQKEIDIHVCYLL